MAIVKNGLFALGAHGKIGKELIYDTSMGKARATAWHKPGGSPSRLQVTSREVITRLKTAYLEVLKGDMWRIAKWRDSLRLYGRKTPIWSEFCRIGRRFIDLGDDYEIVECPRVELVCGQKIIAVNHNLEDIQPFIPTAIDLECPVEDRNSLYVFLWGYDYLSGGTNYYTLSIKNDWLQSWDYMRIWCKIGEGETFLLFPFAWKKDIVYLT